MWVLWHCEDIKQIKLQNWKFAYRCGLLLHNCNNNKKGIFHFIWNERKNVWFVYTRPHLSSLLWRLVYTCLWLVYSGLHSSSDSSVFRIDLNWWFNLALQDTQIFEHKYFPNLQLLFGIVDFINKTSDFVQVNSCKFGVRKDVMETVRQLRVKINLANKN